MQNKNEQQYLNLVDDILRNGHQKGDRTGTGTLSTFGQQMRFDLFQNKLPLLTTKRMHTHSIIHELLWFLAGDTNVKYLQDNNVRIWNEWADSNGDLGPVYGKQWREWKHSHIIRNDWDKIEHENNTNTTFNATVVTNTTDQIAEVIDKLRNNPNDRRIIVSAWNVGEIGRMALPPCHLLFQFWSRELTMKERTILKENDPTKRALSCQMYQRSCDVGLGVPFNIAQYSILTHMVAQVTNHVATDFVWTGGDTHIYNNHVDALTEQLSREPFDSPTLRLNTGVEEIDDFVFEDFEIAHYQCHPTIKMEVSV